ncbi:MAG: electron transfer flavoprotein subunit beta/FixA family protein [Bacteroidota bacterium]
MKLVVCVNHVPDTETKVNVNEDGKKIHPVGVNWMLNPFDEYAIEEALRLKEKNGGEVIALTLGGDAHKETLRKSLAMGVDKAMLLKDDTLRDSFAIGKALADAIKDMSADMILFGKQSIDYYDEQIPGIVGELLGIPSVSTIVKMEIADGKVHCEREIEGGHETVETSLPVVISAQKGLNEPRYPSLKGIMGAKSKPIEEKIPAAFPLKVETLAMHKPIASRVKKIIGTDDTAVPELIRLLHEEAKVI